MQFQVSLQPRIPFAMADYSESEAETDIVPMTLVNKDESKRSFQSVKRFIDGSQKRRATVVRQGIKLSQTLICDLD